MSVSLRAPVCLLRLFVFAAPSLSTAWNSFTNIRTKFPGWLASHDLLSHRNCATEYHNLGRALMDHSSLKNHLQYAMKAFERDYAISCTIHKPKMESIAALRQLAECSLQLQDYVAAVRYAEQALTNAVQSHQVIERQGAVMALGLICMHWFDNACLASRRDDQGELILSECDSWGLLEREQLLDQTRAFMLHAQALASKLPDDEEKKAGLLLEAKINLANSLQQRCAFLSLKHTHTKRLTELKKELAEPPSALYTPALQTEAEMRAVLTRIDCSPFLPSHPFDSFKLTPPGAVDLYKQVKAIIDDAETHCFEEPLWAERWNRTPLPDLGKTWEIDEPALSVPKRVQIAPHSKVLHIHGMVLESLGLVEDALKRYLSSVRRLNCMRGPAGLTVTRTDTKGYTQIVDDQCVSLKAALYAYLKLDQYDRASSMAQQLCKLNNEAKDILRKDEKLADAYKIERDRAKELIKIIQRKRGWFRELERIKTDLAAWKAESDPTLVRRYALVKQRRDVYKQAVVHARHPEHEDLDDSKQTQGYNVQGMLNAEREMWRIVRTQRKRLHPQRDQEEWKLSLQGEGHLLISIAQSVCAMSDLLFADSPVKQLERQLCDKYWKLARQWQQHVLPPLIGRSLHEWEGMALIEHAGSLHDLRDNEETVLNLQREAWAQLELVTDATTRSRLLLTRRDLAESIADTLKLQAARSSATLAKKTLYVEWKAIFAALSAEWTKLSEATDTASKQLAFENEHMEEMFEGNEMPVMGATDVAAMLTDAAEESVSVRSLIKPPSSKPIPTLDAASSRAAPAAPSSVSTAAASSSSASPHVRTAPRGAATTRAAPDPSSNRDRKRQRIVIASQSSSDDDEEDAHAASSSASSSSDDEDEDEVREVAAMDVIDMTAAAATGASAPRPAAAEHSSERRVTFADAVPGNSASFALSVPASVVSDVQPFSAPVVAPAAIVPPTAAAPVAPLHALMPAAAASVPMFAVAASAASESSRSVRAAPAAASAVPALSRRVAASPSVSSAVQTIAGEWREEFVVALRKLESDRGQCQQLSLIGDRFSLAAREELCHVLRMEAAASSPCKPLGQLQSLDLSFCSMEEDAWWTWVLVALPKLPRLRSLNLSHTTVASNMAAHIDRCNTRSPLLRCIDLTGCNRMTGRDKGFDSAFIVQALTSNPRLEELILTGCPLSLKTVSQLMRAIRSNGLSSLRVLSLSFVRSLCYRLSAAEGEESTLPVEPEDEVPFASASAAHAAWRSSLATPAALGPSDCALVRDIYAGLAEWLVDFSDPSLRRNIHLGISGWSNGLNLLSTLVRVLQFPSCRLQKLEFRESDFTRAQLFEMADAIASTYTTTQKEPSLQMIQFTSIQAKQTASMHELLTATLPRCVAVIGETDTKQHIVAPMRHHAQQKTQGAHTLQSAQNHSENIEMA